MHTTPLERLSRLNARRKTVANASAASVISLAVVGLLIGSGAASTAVGVSDGITWLTEGVHGQVLQYNPSTKRVERAFEVGGAGDGIHAAQGDGIVVLRNERNGEIITVDMSRMRAGGMRASRGSSKVLVARGMVLVLDRQRNRVSRVDPVTAGDVGEPWSAPSTWTIADVAADDAGTVWVVGTDSNLRKLEWDSADGRFVEQTVQRVEFVGADALLVAHQKGVTVFGPRAGVVAQFGTPNDGYFRSNDLIGVSPAPVNGPADLVPGAFTDRSAIMILDRGQLRRVATNGLGCLRPSRPVAFNDTVYVVCQGSQKVIQLTRDGGVAGPAISMPGPGDAEPVTDEGRLLFNVSGASEGIEIDRRGAAERFDRLPAGEAKPIKSTGTDLGAAGSLKSGREQARQDLASAAAAEGPASATTTGEAGDRSPTEVLGPEPEPTPSSTPTAHTPAPAPAATPEPTAPSPPTTPVPVNPAPAPTAPAESEAPPSPVQPPLEPPVPPMEPFGAAPPSLAPAPTLEMTAPEPTGAPATTEPPPVASESEPAVEPEPERTVERAPQLTHQPVPPREQAPSPDPVPTEDPEPQPTRQPTPEPELSGTPSPGPEPSETPVPEHEPSLEPSPVPTQEPELTPTPSPEAEPSRTPSPEAEPSRTPSPEAERSRTPPPLPTRESEPTRTPSVSPQPTPSPSSPAATSSPTPSSSQPLHGEVRLSAPVIVAVAHGEGTVSVTWLPVADATSYSVQCENGSDKVTTELTASLPCDEVSVDQRTRVGVRALSHAGVSPITWAVVPHR